MQFPFDKAQDLEKQILHVGLDELSSHENIYWQQTNNVLKCYDSS